MAKMDVDRRLIRTCRVVAVLLVALLFCLPTGIQCQERTENRCLSGNGTEGTKGVNVTLTCGEGFAISVGEASLSRNPVLCGRLTGDCSERIDVFSQECDGYRTCTVILRKTYTRSCGYATYLRVIYDCVPAIRILERTSTQDPSALRLTPEGEGQEGQDSVTSPPLSTDPYPGPRTQPTTSPDDMALIVGCAVAVIITAIVLIIAIVLVVRRLCSSGAAAEGGEKRRGLGLFRGCADLGCIKPPAYPSTSGQASAAAANSALESRLTPIGAPSLPNLVDPSPNPVPAGPVSVATVATAHAQPGPSVQHVQPQQHGQPGQQAQQAQQANPMAPVPTVSASVRSSARFDAVGLPNTETVSSC